MVHKDEALSSTNINLDSGGGVETITPKTKTPHYFWIDALRGLAALGVTLFHARVEAWVTWNEISAHPESFSAFDRMVALLSLPLALGGTCVMLFFLLSGFCIHLPYVYRPQLELKSYFARRLLRIYPPYLAALIVGIALEMARRHFHIEPITKNETIIKSIFMVQSYFAYSGQINTNYALWSLPVEVEMYMVYPILYFVWRRFGAPIAWVMVGATTALAAFLYYAKLGSWVHSNFAVYWVIWFAGAFLADKTNKNLPAWRTWYWIWPLVLGIVASGLLMKYKAASPSLNWLWGMVYLPILWWAIGQKKPSPKLEALLGWLGRISFSLYLMHIPTLIILNWLWTLAFGGKPVNFLITLAFSGLCLLAASVFYQFVELPSHKLARNWGRKASNTSTA